MDRSGKEAILSLLIALCLFCELYFHMLNHIDVTYTHLFYVPILLAAVWYQYQSLYIVGVLGGLHIFNGAMMGDVLAPAFRILLMVIVAYLVAYLVTWQGCVDEDIEGLKTQARETLAQLRELTESLKA